MVVACNLVVDAYRVGVDKQFNHHSGGKNNVDQA